LWVVHEVEQIQLNFLRVSELRQGIQIKVNLPDLDQKKIIHRTQKPVDDQPTAKFLSLSDSEEEEVKPAKQNQNNNNHHQQDDKVINVESD